MGLILRGSIVLPVWLGSTRTRPLQVSLPSPPDSILPMQVLTSSFHHFTETAQGFGKITYFRQENDLEETIGCTKPEMLRNYKDSLPLILQWLLVAIVRSIEWKMMLWSYNKLLLFVQQPITLI
ncbi:UNVERIFIED_CONTAM: hypothetical protein NCL1_39876 [Trichonephila clavipes]